MIDGLRRWWAWRRGERSCRHVVEVITDYLEGALPERERRAVDRHLAECPGCDAYLEEMRATIRITGTLSPRDVPAPVADALLDAFRRVSGRGDGERA